MSRRSNTVQVLIKMVKPRSAAKKAIIQRVTEWRQNPDPNTYQSVMTEAWDYHNEVMAKIRANVRKAVKATGNRIALTTPQLNQLIRRTLGAQLSLTHPSELSAINQQAIEDADAFLVRMEAANHAEVPEVRVIESD